MTLTTYDRLMSPTRPVMRQQPSLGNAIALAQLPRPLEEYPQCTPSTCIGEAGASRRSPRTVSVPATPFPRQPAELREQGSVALSSGQQATVDEHTRREEAVSVHR